MGSTVLVTGGTGRLGSLVVARLAASGRQVRVLSRQPQAGNDGVAQVRGDLTTGAGVEAAVAGVEVVVHCAGNAKGDERMTATLAQAALRAGVGHLAYISVVGAERVPVVSGFDRMAFGYFAAKLAAERALSASGLPYSILRATQFQESMLALARQLVKSPVIPAPTGSRFQPVAVDEVAARLVELAMGEPAGLVPELGGPHAYLLDELIRSFLARTGRRRLFVPLHMTGKAAAGVRAGANLTPDHAVGVQTWEQLLANG
ncbi:NmrA family transcriptional regulator [Arthrobacter sp. ERGS1:01]|uniref:SDR family oxidoreductase n=1 Tax=Arthrobacter sp. ERGS1:01 TaxID=1704044 RepID=UPI0006B479FA|nr:NAD(P)H-binding protein [Arthrobacter sp. ERGS1:01]ALE05441.1 NmrA family transcriptional regulator [Arthrobacter sp. ERGS1:01]